MQEQVSLDIQFSDRYFTIHGYRYQIFSPLDVMDVHLQPAAHLQALNRVLYNKSCKSEDNMCLMQQDRISMVSNLFYALICKPQNTGSKTEFVVYGHSLRRVSMMPREESKIWDLHILTWSRDRCPLMENAENPQRRRCSSFPKRTQPRQQIASNWISFKTKHLNSSLLFVILPLVPQMAQVGPRSYFISLEISKPCKMSLI